MTVEVGFVVGMMAPMTPNGAYSTRVSPWSPVQEVGTRTSVPGTLSAFSRFFWILSSNLPEPGLLPGLAGEELRVLPCRAAHVADHLLANVERQRHQLFEGLARRGDRRVDVGEEVVAVAKRVGARRWPLGVHLRQRRVGTALPLPELRHHLADDRLDVSVVHHQPTPALEYVTAPPTSNVSTMATITPSQGRLSVTSVRRAELPVA